MNAPSIRPILLGLALAAPLIASADSTPARERLSLDEGWRFIKGDPPGQGETLGYFGLSGRFLAMRDAFLGRKSEPPAGAEPRCAYAEAAYDDSSWRLLDLPHDWGVEGAFDPKEQGGTGRLHSEGVAWYRRHLAVPEADALRLYYLQIDGAMSYASVWVNGHLAGGWPYGYSSFEINLTRWLKVGADNVIAIRLDNPPDASRWYPGGGIYRNVWLVRTNELHVAHWGTYVTTPRVSADAATVSISTAIERDSCREVGMDAPVLPVVRVSTEIFALDSSGARIGSAVASAVTGSIAIGPGEHREIMQSAVISRPELWSIGSPRRYVAVTTVADGNRLCDVYETPFGIRTLGFDPSRGFFLNGRHLKFQGVCDHHDLGALGAAIDVHGLERQLSELKAMGCNAIRTSHNPPAPELLDLCDRMGLVVMDEAFDCWVQGKRPNDYHLLFADWHEADMRALIRRDRNHPSVVMWSIGNEIPDQATPLGPKLAAELVGICHQEDPTRPATSACNYVESADNGFGDQLDVFGYNYRWWRYPAFRADHPYKFLFGSETDSTVSTRGAYAFPVSQDKSKGTTADFQVSSYDLSAPHWAFPPDDEFRAEDEHPEVGGQFVWTGFDYLGEPTPFGEKDDPARSSYFGIIDLAGFPKDRFYLYQAKWRPDLPMAHLVPHWTWPGRAGRTTPVFVYTSGDEAELFLNGRSLGKRHAKPGEYRLRWDDVRYEPGELKVVVTRNGRPWAEAAERTAGPAAAIRLEADRTLLPGGRATAYLTASVVDKDGTPCPDAANRIRFTISGPARIVATDNGDPTCLEPFEESNRAAFHGLALAIVRTEAGASGPITVAAGSPGLAPASVELKSD